ncbi:hypothetical protein GLYMA_13G111950v4 [Glycine max]|nr:hypothetical protein GLYMA_13G111950v4 [Glycine max]KAH1100900.1 hypothetical protein GYH30_035841 [Glycine max]
MSRNCSIVSLVSFFFSFFVFNAEDNKVATSFFYLFLSQNPPHVIWEISRL